jgi:hypothetical protein
MTQNTAFGSQVRDRISAIARSDECMPDSPIRVDMPVWKAVDLEVRDQVSEQIRANFQEFTHE